MIDNSQKFKIGDTIDVIKPDYPSYHWGEGIVTSVEQREYGCIMAKFKNNNEGTFFQEEIILIKRKEKNE